MSSERPDWNERYRSGDLPWETGRVDSNLVHTIEEFSIEPCSVLDIGCGTGNNAVWLARQGFRTTAIDLSPLAIEESERRSGDLGITFKAANILTESVPNAPFGLIFDRGCFHSMQSDEDKSEYARITHEMLEEKGLWISLMGNADQPEREFGPPRVTASKITSLLEPLFEVLYMRSSFFDSDQEDPPRCWVCLMRRR